MKTVPIVRDVVLVGGGHSHVLLIRRWAMKPMPGVRLTLVSSAVFTPYSGMLPGLVAGHYTQEDIHIDLLRLCAWANVRFIEQSVTRLDLDSQCVCFESRPEIGFDILSLDTGSTPDLNIPGAAEHTTPVKPVSDFNKRWQKIRHTVEASPNAERTVGVVGSGAGGFELICAMRHALPEHMQCFWFLRGSNPLRGRPDAVGRLALTAASRAGIQIVKNFDVVEVKQKQLIAADGRVFDVDDILWCTSAVGPAWLACSGLDLDARGFVATNAFLQSVSHEYVFATGDVGTQIDTPSSKAGVFAVRQAPILCQNIRRLLLQGTLKTYTPQKDFLSLMATGPKSAIASRRRVAIEGAWVWRMKHWIDQRFMDKFKSLPVRDMKHAEQTVSPALQLRGTASNKPHVVEENSDVMLCRGCGAKVGDRILQKVLSGFTANERRKLPLLSAMTQSVAEDSAVLGWPSQLLVQSVDQINAIVDDPFTLGRIAALHALSDVFTLNASVHSAQILITLPEAAEPIVERELTLVMQGVLNEFENEACALVGGHTSQGAELSIGLVVNAALDQSSEREPVKVNIGDRLVLTQSLGAGVLFAALMQDKARGNEISAAIGNMLISNRRAAQILYAHEAALTTDVTGFGLLGHLQRLMSSAPFGVTVHGHTVPLIPGALRVAQQGVRSTLWLQNSAILDEVEVASSADGLRLELLCDPQTGGGLLSVVPADQAASAVQQLHAAGYRDASIIGSVIDGTGIQVTGE
ncbi:MAG: selenide, water dikinase SelD [Granulosicoccus sp.]